jgi:hypothetical protein
MVQFRNITDKNLEQWKGLGKQVIVYPPQFKGGDAVVPYDKARAAK